jgi:hypothetical protein
MQKGMPKSVWVVVDVQSGVPVDVEVFEQENRARRCLNSWRRTVREDYDTVSLFESIVK